MENIAELNDDAPDAGNLEQYVFHYPFEDFKNDMRWVFYLQAQMINAMSDPVTALQLLGKAEINGSNAAYFDPECIPEDLDFTYEHIRQTPFARSLEAMYRYAYHGEIDHTLEPLGPGGYHIVMAAIINDLATSRLVNFWMYIGGQGKESVMNCLRTAELANARLVLEGHERFFNFEGNEDYASLTKDANERPPQGGFGRALTIRQMALLADMGEPTIRTAANRKRPGHIPTFSHGGRTLISIDDAKAWLKRKGRYLPVKTGKDLDVVNLAARRIADINDLLTIISVRLSMLDCVAEKTPRRATLFHELSKQFGFTVQDASALWQPEFLHALADLLSFPHELFFLRVKEMLVSEQLNAVRQELRIASEKTLLGYA
ncbi:hypothetical protein RY831_30860 [Noviherbaspirillum sp. CPCC 100848]|uniref:Uncharacterized protein n=1 Tax=Noviherbaspirillum album TaxID=3080276 RepID=A0ABU6JIQ8_9BURK|nr:hypothetical protein [Noviherbaspirillum sp. CPCC 100848]MEC4723544.1 hypothetical protein [Noviherbaspirillum sp. CPCC 100848]